MNAKGVVFGRARGVLAAVVFLAAIWIAVRRPAGVVAAASDNPSERKPIVLDRPAARRISDPNPVFRAVVVDPVHGEVFMANDKESAGTSINVYNTVFPNGTDKIIEPKRRIAGPAAGLGMVCGLALSPQHGELYVVSGETGELRVFPLDANGNVGPERRLNGIVPRASEGIYLDAKDDELYFTTEHVNRINVYPRNFKEDQDPLRYIQGPDTGLADPHGIYVDSNTNEIFVNNHGNWRAMQPGEGERRGPDSLTRSSLGYTEPGKEYPLAPSTGKFFPPSITVHSRLASGDARPLRVIQGPHTQLALPDGIFRDPETGEIIVANTGDDSVLFFPKDASGDTPPDRVLKGPKTLIKGPTGVAIDPTRHELWVTSWDAHVASVFPENANGNIAPLRTIRSAPPDAPMASLGRIGAVVYDPKRDQILAPN